MRPDRPDLVIFDCDGVLVDSEPISGSVLAAALSRAGPEITGGEARARYQGMLLADIGEDAERRIGVPLPDDFWERFDLARQAAFEQSLTPVEGAAETIAAIQAAGIRTCVASQGRLQKTELTLGLTGLRSYFADEELFSAYGVARPKPFPDLFVHAAEQMGTAPDGCVVVEDTAIGVQAAREARMRVIAYVPPGAEAPESSVPTIRHLPELVPMVLDPHTATSSERAV